MAPVRNRIAVMHGVNLDMLGSRDPEHYGTLTLAELQSEIGAWARDLSLETIFFNSNHEGDFVEFCHRLPETADAAILNPGAWTHYSWAIHDAVQVSGVPVVEVHLSDVDSREQWRRTSVLEDIRVGRVAGKGADGYRDALEMLAGHLEGGG